MESRIYGGADVDWSKIIGDWYMAIGYSDPTNLHGFKGEFNYELGIHNITGNDSTTNLLPGEGVFDLINSSFTPSSEPDDIYFVGIEGLSGIDRLSGSQDTSSPYSGEVILAWNGSSLKEDSFIITPISPSSIVFTNSVPGISLSVSNNPLPESYPIGVSFPDPGSGKIKRDDK